MRSFSANEHNIIAMQEFIDKTIQNFRTDFEKKSILDVGCGDGAILKMINEQVPTKKLTGISICREDIFSANHSDHYSVKFGDMHSIPMRNKSADSVICRHCLEHSPSPFFVLLEIHRVLREGGLLAVVLPADTDVWINYPTHFSCMPKANWYKLFKDAGFEIESEEEGFWFAVFTQKEEKEWRFILRRISGRKHEIKYEPFYRELLFATSRWLKHFRNLAG
jgi:SAM-dependent methyltransferase